MDKNEIRKYAGLPLDESVSKAGSAGVSSEGMFGGKAELRVKDWRGSVLVDGSGDFGSKEHVEIRFDSIFIQTDKAIKNARTTEEDKKIATQKIKAMDKAASKFYTEIQKILEK